MVRTLGVWHREKTLGSCLLREDTGLWRRGWDEAGQNCVRTASWDAGTTGNEGGWDADACDPFRAGKKGTEIFGVGNWRLGTTEKIWAWMTYLFTYSMAQSPSWEANWFAVSKEIPRISRNPKVHYRTHKRPPPVSIPGQPNPVHIPTSHLL